MAALAGVTVAVSTRGRVAARRAAVEKRCLRVDDTDDDDGDDGVVVSSSLEAWHLRVWCCEGRQVCR